MYLLSTGLNKTLQLQQDFAKGLEPKIKWSCSKNVAIGRHVEQINAIQVAYIMDGGLEAKPPVNARSQKFAMMGVVLGSSGGQWGYGGEAPSRHKHRGLGAPSARKFWIFLQK